MLDVGAAQRSYERAVVGHLDLNGKAATAKPRSQREENPLGPVKTRAVRRQKYAHTMAVRAHSAVNADMRTVMDPGRRVVPRLPPEGLRDAFETSGPRPFAKPQCPTIDA